MDGVPEPNTGEMGKGAGKRHCWGRALGLCGFGEALGVQGAVGGGARGEGKGG